MKNKEKVYCIDCKYFIDSHNPDAFEPASCNYLQIIIEDFIRGPYNKHITVESEDYPNKNGECSFYKKKWWKFWIKENRVSKERRIIDRVKWKWNNI